MDKLSRKNMIFVSLMLFSMFFGAGNLIFPPFLGQSSGVLTWISMAGFITSAIGLPILAVAAVSKTGGLYNLAKKVHPFFGFTFTIIIYLAIGPFLGIPRAGSLAFEMGIYPFLSDGLKSNGYVLLLYTLIYFSIAFWLSLTPSKLVDRFGKILTPILLMLISIIFISSLFTPVGKFSMPTEEYAKNPFFKGFLEGYMTMDAIAALNFGIVIAVTLKRMGVRKEEEIVSHSIKAGLIAGFFLLVVYAMLSYLGAVSQVKFGEATNGAVALTNMVLYLFGKPGAILLGVIFSLACLTTSVGLITSCSEYFTSLNSKVSYKTWVIILSVSSMTLANMGLTKILKISVPILTAIYPMAITLILLSFTNKFLKDKSNVYLFSIISVSIISVTKSLEQFGLKLDFMTNLFKYLPFYSIGLEWITPAITGAIIGFVFSSNKIEEMEYDSNYV